MHTKQKIRYTQVAPFIRMSKRIKNYIKCELIQNNNSMAILTEQFLEIREKWSLLNVLLSCIINVFKYFKWLRGENYLLNKIKFSMNTHYFSLNDAFFKTILYFLGEILKLGYVCTCYAWSSYFQTITINLFLFQWFPNSQKFRNMPFP